MVRARAAHPLGYGTSGTTELNEWTQQHNDGTTVELQRNYRAGDGAAPVKFRSSSEGNSAFSSVPVGELTIR
jgi:hypothetical protein